MRRKKSARTSENNEEEKLEQFVDNIWPREPTLRIYRVDEKTKKQTLLGSADLDTFELDLLRERYGAGCFLLRTVRSNGTWGPSRMVWIAVPKPAGSR
jgi:hypothetical protein